MPDTRVGLRDRALLLLGFAGAFRRSELVSLDVADLEFSQAGLIVSLRKSKTDQEGKSRPLGIPLVAFIVKRRAKQAGLDPARFAGPACAPGRPPLGRHGPPLHPRGEPVAADNAASLAGL